LWRLRLRLRFFEELLRCSAHLLRSGCADVRRAGRKLRRARRKLLRSPDELLQTQVLLPYSPVPWLLPPPQQVLWFVGPELLRPGCKLRRADLRCSHGCPDLRCPDRCVLQLS
jgi:hypothetical protein